MVGLSGVVGNRADAGRLDDRRYWEPVHRPVDKPLSYFVHELAERLARAVSDRTPGSGGEYDLLSSGGSDSRAVLAAGESSVDSYHLGDGWNREARAAKRAADAVGSRPDSCRHRCRRPGARSTSPFARRERIGTPPS